MGKRRQLNRTSEDDKVKDKLVNKKIKFEECEAERDSAFSKETRSKTNEKKNSQSEKNNLRNKKLKETDDGATSKEVHKDSIKDSENKKNTLNDNSVTVQTQNDSKKKRRNKSGKVFQNDEEEVKEEDIDKFCDELTEEDNIQYENWVRLVDAQLHSNKKKPN